ncbi:MAG: DUF692 domain-containing protein [Neomegalonema sp.]|nr:DUF692 domain-containing protein [Neomegalonema sp.]
MPMSHLPDERVNAQIPNRSGVGFKGEHLADILAEPGPVGWFEIHAENYMGAGGPPHRMLERLRRDYPLSVHGVGLSIGAEKGLDPAHLERLKGVIDRYDPGLVSEHLAWSSHDVGYLNDLLPVPYTDDVLARIVEHIDQVQSVLGRQILLENPSTYVRFDHSTWTEVDFIKEIARRSGCRLLLDVNNVFVSCTNHDQSAEAYLDGFPLELVGEIHLGGHAPDTDEIGAPLLIDAHDREVADPVWALYAQLIAELGALPSLIEWDNDVPAWSVLREEARRADAILCDADQVRAEPQLRSVG